MKTFSILGLGCAVFIGAGVLYAGANACGYLGEAVKVAREEFGPRELLRKYEWFKDAAAQCEAKLATIERLKSQINTISESYGLEVKRPDWSREDKQTINVWQTDLSAAMGSYNSLAGEYNAQMAKFNYRFCNVGELPEGATHPLPREFKPYIN